MKQIYFVSVESLTLTKMDRLTITPRIKIIETYYKNGDFTTDMYRALKEDYGLHNRPTTQAVGKTVKKFEETRVVTNIQRPVHHRFAHSAKNIAIVNESVAEDSNVTIPRRPPELGPFYGILPLDLHLHPYKVQLTHQLKPADHSQRRRYVE